ncbi:hypothetical protein LTR62_004683 [Meristemomyces frigidus]|uniref:Major facilitator superfamily (MFS) profile domain-containing protein n=1 Tax=Meristemomyces frigidus TaxID=1508187 RepID=A0AAN7YFY1_9PEZI|nr:hypothetical protein LTR62_004683 [Meristemomyces frigidus]
MVIHPDAESDSKIDAGATATAYELGIASDHIADTKGADGVLRYAAAIAVEIDEPTNKRLLRLIDYHVLPWLCGLYILQYLDKGVLSYAGVMGLQKELHMDSLQYSWLGSIYYVGYIPAVPLHNRLMQRFPPSKYIAVCMALWGVVLTTMAACDSWAGLMVQRTALGSLEASVNAGFMLVTASWYRKYEHASRVGTWSACVGLANIIGGAIAYGCVAGYESHPSAKFTSWKILALCTGLISVVYGICMYLFLAGSVVTASWLSEDDRILAVERLRGNHQGIGSTKYKKYQAKEAWLDYRTWTYVLFVLSSQIPAAGLVLFNSVLIKSLGFDTKTTLLLSMPGGLVNICCNYGFGWLADRTKKRLLACILANLISIFGAALFIGLGNVSPLHDRIGQLVGYYLMSGSSSTAWFLIISLMSSNVLGYTKKTSSNAIVFVFQGLAYFVGPLCFTDGPYYHKAKDMTIGLWTASTALLAVMWLLNHRENAKRDQEMAAKGVSEQAAATELAFHDLTDKENKGFRYVT